MRILIVLAVGVFSIIVLKASVFITDLTGFYVNPALVGLGILCVGFIGYQSFSIYNSNSEAKAARESRIRELEVLTKKTESYREALGRKRQILIQPDDYGDLDDEKWQVEIRSFIRKKLLPVTMKNGQSPQDINEDEIAEIVDEVATKAQAEIQKNYEFCDTLDGIEYEHYCSDLLEKFGWKTKVLPASGDQGADVIAEKADVTVAIQCKKYSTPVGNKAVQEVYGSIRHYNAKVGVVVTSNSFTRSAKELANTTGVLLLHHTQLSQLDEFLFDSDPSHEK